jgi:hypothetical protein
MSHDQHLIRLHKKNVFRKFLSAFDFQLLQGRAMPRSGLSLPHDQ